MVDSKIDEENLASMMSQMSSNSSSSKQTAQTVVSLDLGNLLAFDPRPLEPAQLKTKTAANKEEYLKNLCTLSTQLLVDSLFQLPIERVEDVVIAKLPKPVTILPREKPLPKQKPPTKWELYAKMKGIQKKKKSRKVFDEASGEWKPTWGYKRKNDSTKEWCIEIKKNEDPNQDFFTKRTLARNERVAKNELQRLRNVARATKKKVPGVGLTPNVAPNSDKPDKLQLKKQLNMAKRSDASMSKFSKKLTDEDKVTKGFGRKRKFESNFKDIKDERSNQLKIFDRIASGKDKPTKERIRSDKAANKFISDENNKMSNKKPHNKRRSSAGGHKNIRSKNKRK